VLDLSPERLAAILDAEPELAPELGEILASPLTWWHRLDAEVKPRLLEGLAQAIGDDAVLADAASNWRMVDYYSLPPQPSVPSAPRCGEHRDFGSMTLVFSDRPGLEIFMDGEWRPIEQPEEDASSTSAILLFGWCTEIRSNGRIRAALHRVDASLSERRLSAVLFVAPKCAQTPLEPVLLGNEERVYISGIKVGQLRGDMSRKWRWREGTLSSQDRLLEEHEIRVEKIVSQDDVIRRSAVASR
jgi:isopenicillin N synthase-like dioxygenase